MDIRKAKFEDLEEIVEIYNQAIKTKISTGDLEPITIGNRTEWYYSHSSDRYPLFVLEENKKIIGWGTLSSYIHENYQRKGFGRALAEYMIKECNKLDIHNLFAIVLQKNTGSIKLLKKLKFKKWGFMPEIADFNGLKCGHYYFGIHLK